jgi:hypothetical protein
MQTFLDVKRDNSHWPRRQHRLHDRMSAHVLPRIHRALDLRDHESTESMTCGNRTFAHIGAAAYSAAVLGTTRINPSRQLQEA